jgi:hypothetical protein
MTRTLCLLALLTLAACGGGGGGSSSPTPTPTPTPAPTPTSTGLAYVDPPATGWRWAQNPLLSSPGHLVLELQGPGPGVSGRGVAFSLLADPTQVFWASYPSTVVENLVFNLGTGPQLMATSRQGGLLVAGIFQKGQGNAVAMNGALCRVSLAPTPGSTLTRGTTLALTVPNLQLFPDSGNQLVTQTCAVGVLSAQ